MTGRRPACTAELMDYDDQQLSQELQAISSLWGGRLSLVGGLFYIHQKASSAQDTGPDYDDPLGYTSATKIANTSEGGLPAGHGQGYRQVECDRGVVRYSHDHTNSSFGRGSRVAPALICRSTRPARAAAGFPDRVLATGPLLPARGRIPIPGFSSTISGRRMSSRI